MNKENKIPTVGTIVEIKAAKDGDDDFGGRARVMSVQTTLIPAKTEIKGDKIVSSGEKICTGISTKFSYGDWECDDYLCFEQEDNGPIYYLPSSRHDAFGRIEVTIKEIV